MRRALIALSLSFVFAFGFGLATGAPADADPTPCFYKCGCNGAVFWCCGTSCKPATGPTPIQCPQEADC